mmetsp:Transcript_47402/g.140010  ORF Transcript_47402/g.140010 Transcript_47402/m.140010 type:complete len:499 (-) Transcript_47402:274-1770(-)
MVEDGLPLEVAQVVVARADRHAALLGDGLDQLTPPHGAFPQVAQVARGHVVVGHLREESVRGLRRRREASAGQTAALQAGDHSARASDAIRLLLAHLGGLGRGLVLADDSLKGDRLAGEHRLDGLQVDQVEVTQPLDLAARAARQRVEGAYGARAVDAGRRRLVGGVAAEAAGAEVADLAGEGGEVIALGLRRGRVDKGEVVAQVDRRRLLHLLVARVGHGQRRQCRLHLADEHRADARRRLRRHERVVGLGVALLLQVSRLLGSVEAHHLADHLPPQPRGGLVLHHRRVVNVGHVGLALEPRDRPLQVVPLARLVGEAHLGEGGHLLLPPLRLLVRRDGTIGERRLLVDGGGRHEARADVDVHVVGGQQLGRVREALELERVARRRADRVERVLNGGEHLGLGRADGPIVHLAHGRVDLKLALVLPRPHHLHRMHREGQVTRDRVPVSHLVHQALLRLVVESGRPAPIVHLRQAERELDRRVLHGERAEVAQRLDVL